MTQLLMYTEDKRMERLEAIGGCDTLDRINQVIPWAEIFGDDLNTLWNSPDKAEQGRNHYDSILMFKILIVQSMYNLSDDKMQREVADRLSFQKFLHISAADPIPDSTTIWYFRRRLKKANLLNRLFNRFDEFLNTHNFEMGKGQMVDATFVEVPRQHNTQEENEYIKENNKAPEDWSDKKKSQKDTDARWTKKNNKSYYGYKNHVNVDVLYKFIRQFTVTPANVHDSKAILDLLMLSVVATFVYADSAYYSKEIAEAIILKGLKSMICSKGCRNKKLTEEEKKQNHEKSRTRCRVEHVFGQMSQLCNGNRRIRAVGLDNVTTKVALTNIAYNITRYCYLTTGKICK